MSASTKIPLRPDLLPVVLGGDIGAYALARQLHEATGQRVVLLSPSPIKAITLSSYIDVIKQDSRDESALLKTLLELVSGREERSAIVIGNRDSTARFLATYREQLEPRYVVPFPTLEVMDTLSNKVSFAQTCQRYGLLTPKQVVVQGKDLLQGDPQIDLPFPLVGKAAVGADWDELSFPGKRKIYLLDTPAQLHELWRDLRAAGFDSTFLIQERIPGLDDAMRSITAYVDSRGKVTLIGSARVLLEDHSPVMIGNPVAMITQAYPQLWAGVEKLLENSDYCGFANFDVKIDPRTKQAIFFEVNPRIGRNSYYLTAAGANPMVPMIRDLVDLRAETKKTIYKEVLYTLLPIHLLLHQLDSWDLRKRVLHLAFSAVDPLLDPAEPSWRRRLLIMAQKFNYDRKFHRYHPKSVLNKPKNKLAE